MRSFGSTPYILFSLLALFLFTTSPFCGVQAAPLRQRRLHRESPRSQKEEYLSSQPCQSKSPCLPFPSAADLVGAGSAQGITITATYHDRRTHRPSAVPTETEAPRYVETRVILIAGSVAGAIGLLMIFGVIFYFRRKAFARAFRKRKSRMGMWPSPRQGGSLTRPQQGLRGTSSHRYAQRPSSRPSPPPKSVRHMQQRKSRREWKSAHPPLHSAQSSVSTTKQSSIRLVPQQAYLSPYSTSQPHLSPFSTSQPLLSPSSVGSIQSPARMLSLHSINRQKELQREMQHMEPSQHQSPLTPPAPKPWKQDSRAASPVELPATPLGSSHFETLPPQKKPEPRPFTPPVYQTLTRDGAAVSPNFASLPRPPPVREEQRRDSATYEGFI